MGSKGILVLAIGISALMPIPTKSVARQSTPLTEHIRVITGDRFNIHVTRKLMEGIKKTPVLLVHETWGNSQTWDLPGRSVMNYLARRGYDVYALDLRGMGQSDGSPNFFAIGLLDCVRDVAPVAGHILQVTGCRPVIAGWSQGGLLTGMVAVKNPKLVAGVGLFGIPGEGFYIPPEFVPLFELVIAAGADRYLPSADVAFGFDPVNGKPTISDEAFQAYANSCDADSVRVILEEFSPEYFRANIAPPRPNIHVPALVVDGALDINVGEERAQALFDTLDSDGKQLLISPRNFHGWFLEDNHEATLRAFNRLLSQFRKFLIH